MEITTNEQSFAEFHERDALRRRQCIRLFQQECSIFFVTKSAVFEYVRTLDQTRDATRFLDEGTEEVRVFFAGD